MFITSSFCAMIGESQSTAPATNNSVAELPVVADLPDPFTFSNGKPVHTQQDWRKRRKELIDLILHYEYGRIPPPPGNVTCEALGESTIYSGSTIERKYLLSFGPASAVKLHVNLLLPVKAKGRLPVILTGDLGWNRSPVAEEAVCRGYILAEFDRTEIAPDREGRDIGVYPLYPDYDWRALAAWAWAYHRVVDFLITLPEVDAKRIIITGHSRGGKAVLLAGALDERIAITAPNDSGCGGAGAFRMQGKGSEDMKAIVRNFPFWFSPQLPQFIGNEQRLPFDQHELMALVAPRGLLVTNALGDLWANPEGTQRTYLAAKKVYDFLKASDHIGNHYREGGHEHNAEDWHTLFRFTDLLFKKKPLTTEFLGREF